MKRAFTIAITCMLGTILVCCCKHRVIHKKLLLVLCDFSTSTKAGNTQENLKKNVSDILEKLPASTKFSFYSISGSLGKAFIIDTSSDHPQELKVESLTKFARFSEKIDGMFNEIKADRSCIAAAINSAGEEIKNYTADPRYSSIDLVILSDMLEACYWNNQFVNLEDSSFKPDTAILHKLLPDTSFANSKIRITAILNSGKIDNYDDVRSFWREFFQRKGYTGNVSFGPQIPVNFLD